MKWIKASERIPKDCHRVHWRNAIEKHPIYSPLAVRLMANNKKHEVEWLDESPLPSNEDELELWIDVAKEFHFDRNKHRTMVQSIISRLHNKFSITRK